MHYGKIKAYSLKNNSTKVILAGKEQESISLLNIYYDILYYYHSVEKNGKWYRNVYGISLKDGKIFLVFPYGLEDGIFISESVICFVKMQK